jgi:hypothetical protein
MRPISAADDAEHHRLDQELREDVEAAGADGLANADLAGALGHRDEHDVHDPNAADDERHRRDSADEHRDLAGGLTVMV